MEYLSFLVALIVLYIVLKIIAAPVKIIIKLIKAGVIYNGGVGLYDTFVHYDIGGQGRRWDYRKKK